ncbi:MAG: tRNA epoxyqueuosine(34) reductase QueG [Woeseiaceae bacterium]
MTESHREIPEPVRPADPMALRQRIEAMAVALGFDGIGVSDINIGDHGQHLQRWLDQQFHGEMHYMQRHADLRLSPEQLFPGTIRVISVRLDYLPESQDAAIELLDHNEKAYVSRYALGRDYHKLMRKRLKVLATRIRENLPDLQARPFVDSAPVLEKPLAEKAGLGWIGKHTNLIDKRNGSWFFLGELLTNLELPVDQPASNHCGTCSTCIDVCPTGAIVAPYSLDARRCISYLTIEHAGDIPEPLRKPIGNRIYGCDDCQLFCPWNKFATRTREKDFAPRNGLDQVALTELASWTEDEWLVAMEGSAIRRIGFHRWQRNIAVALGNAKPSDAVNLAIDALQHSPDAQVARHANWAYEEHTKTKRRPQHEA